MYMLMHSGNPANSVVFLQALVMYCIFSHAAAVLAAFDQLTHALQLGCLLGQHGSLKLANGQHHHLAQSSAFHSSNLCTHGSWQ
jgi:hypothetical protein